MLASYFNVCARNTELILRDYEINHNISYTIISCIVRGLLVFSLSHEKSLNPNYLISVPEDRLLVIKIP